MPTIVPAISDAEPCYTVAEARAFFGGVSRITIYNHATKGLRGELLLSHHVGGRLWFKESDLKAFVEATSKPRERLEKGFSPRPRLSQQTVDRLRQLGCKS